MKSCAAGYEPYELYEPLINRIPQMNLFIRTEPLPYLYHTAAA